MSFKTYTLGEIASNTSRRFNFNNKEQVCFVNTGDILDGHFLVDEKVSSIGLPGQAKKAIQKGDILYSEIRPGNKRHLLVNTDVDDYVVSTKFMVITCNQDIVIPEYLYLVLTSKECEAEFKVIADSRSGTFPQITFDAVAYYPIELPSLIQQRAVVEFIKSITGKLNLNNLTNQTLEEMAQAIFKSWFVDFDPVKAKMNGEQPEGMDEATASLFPEKLVESELGLIPEGWEPKQLKDILELAYGKALKKTDRVEGDVPVYGSGGLTGYHNQSLVEGPGIIVGRKGTVGSVYWEPKSFYPIDTVFYVKPKAGYSLKYCHLVLQNLGLKNMNTDAAVPGLNRNNAYRLDVIIPNEAVLDKFNIIMQSFQLLIDANNAQNTNLSLLRDTLLPELLSGKIFNTVTKEG